NKSYLTDYEEIDEGFVGFGGNSKGGKITGKGKIRTDFKLTDESHVLLKVPRNDNMYSVDLKNVVPQGERKNRTLIEAARTMLADLKLPTTFWAEAVNTACYVQNRVLFIKPHNKTPYELFLGRKPALSFMRPFGCPVTILNTIDHLGSRPNWIFDIDALTKSMNYKPIVAGNQSNGSAGKARVETVPDKDYILLSLWTQDPPFSSSSKDSLGASYKPSEEEEKKDAEDLENKDSKIPSTKELRVDQKEKDSVNSTNRVNAVSLTTNTANNEVNDVGRKSSIKLPDDPNMPDLEDIIIDLNEDVFSAEADLNNMKSTFQVSPIPTIRIHKDHPLEKVIKDLQSAPQTMRMSKNLEGNKLDERGIVIRNKAILVAQGHTQEEGKDYDKVFTPVTRIEAIRLFLAYASFKDFAMYQKDVKRAFLYKKIEKERGMIDKTLFIKREKIDIVLVQVYVDDIIFGFTRKEICTEFEKIMHKKFQMSSMGELLFFLASTAMETHKTLLKDKKGKDVDEHLYRSMIGSLMYLTSSRPDIMFATVIANFTTEAEYIVASNCRGQIIDFLNANPIKYALTVNPTVYTSCIKQFWATATAKNINGEAQIHAKVDGKKETQPSDPTDEALNEKNVPTQSNDPPLSRVNTLGSGEDRLKLKELMELYTKLSDRVLNLETTKIDQAKEISSLKRRVKRLEKKKKLRTHGLNRLYKVDLSARVKSSVEEQSLEDQGRINDEEMFDTHVLNDEEMFAESVDVVEQAKENVVDKELIDDITLAKALMEIKSTKPKPDKVVIQEQELDIAIKTTVVTAAGIRPKAKSIVMQEPSETPTTTTIPISLKFQDKGKGIMVEEPLKMKKKDQISFNEKEARRLQAEIDEQDRLAEEKAQLIEDENLAWDNVQAMIDTDYELAARLQEEEQGELTIKEKSRLFVELMDKRKKHFTKLRAEKQRRKPLTKAQKRNQMCIYLKNMAGFTHNQLKNKSFDEVQKEFDKTMSWIKSFTPIDSEVVKDKAVLTQETSLKRAGDELDQERSKKQKVKDDKKSEELKRCLEIILDDGDDVTIDATPLSIKTLIIDYKIYKEGKKSYF
nr:hypothetical protein [Tanacetum cinerariifolium]